ncbi:MAG: hypothetical protein L3K06_04215, partial [Thermoplasmata archaeon]|nr:hypothetical protein [Thermoplasmata archaeon]
NGNLELVALLAVNVPGFPVPRARALVASGDAEPERLALVAAGIVTRTLTPVELARMEVLRDQAAGKYDELRRLARGEG